MGHTATVTNESFVVATTIKVTINSKLYNMRSNLNLKASNNDELNRHKLERKVLPLIAHSMMCHLFQFVTLSSAQHCHQVKFPTSEIE